MGTLFLKRLCNSEIVVLSTSVDWCDRSGNLPCESNSAKIVLLAVIKQLKVYKKRSRRTVPVLPLNFLQFFFEIECAGVFFDDV
jgi:hypothetical protein